LFSFSPRFLVHAQQGPDAARRTVEQIENSSAAPHRRALWFYLSRFRSELGDVKGSTEALEKVAELGDGYMPSPAWADSRGLGRPGLQGVVARIEAKLPRLDFAPSEFEIEDRELIPKASHTTRAPQLLSRQRRETQDPAHRREQGGERVRGRRGGSGRGARHDGRTRRGAPLRVSTSALTEAGRKRLRNSVVVFDVDTGRLLRATRWPRAAQLNDVTVASAARCT
jgi:hypothetical protein